MQLLVSVGGDGGREGASFIEAEGQEEAEDRKWLAP